MLKPLQPAGLSNLENKPSKNIQKNRQKKQKDMEGKEDSISERF